MQTTEESKPSSKRYNKILQKITPRSLDMALATYLNGVPIYENLLSKISLATDEEGKVKFYVMDNVKTVLKVSLQQMIKKDDPNTTKVKIALKNLLCYGTKNSSDNIEEFLSLVEENTTKVKGHSFSNDNDVSLLKILADSGRYQYTPDKLSEISSGLNDIRQVW